jgi:hypothetical protein
LYDIDSLSECFIFRPCSQLNRIYFRQQANAMSVVICFWNELVTGCVILEEWQTLPVHSKILCMSNVLELKAGVSRPEQ